MVRQGTGGLPLPLKQNLSPVCASKGKQARFRQRTVSSVKVRLAAQADEVRRMYSFILLLLPKLEIGYI